MFQCVSVRLENSKVFGLGSLTSAGCRFVCQSRTFPQHGACLRGAVQKFEKLTKFQQTNTKNGFKPVAMDAPPKIKESECKYLLQRFEGRVVMVHNQFRTCARIEYLHSVAFRSELSKNRLVRSGGQGSQDFATRSSRLDARQVLLCSSVEFKSCDMKLTRRISTSQRERGRHVVVLFAGVG